MIVIEYLRIMAAGVASRVWRTLAGRPCPCESCAGHREFLRTTEAMYRAAVLRNPHPVADDEGRPPPAAFLSALGEVRDRRYR